MFVIHYADIILSLQEDELKRYVSKDDIINDERMAGYPIAEDCIKLDCGLTREHCLEAAISDPITDFGIGVIYLN